MSKQEARSKKQEIRNRKWFLLLPFTFYLLTFLFIGCAKKEKGDLTERKVPVQTAPVKRGCIEEIISLTGDIHGQKEAKVYAKVPGKLIKKVKEAGEMVKENDIIALIDRDEAALKFSEAEVKSPIDGVVTMYFAGLGEAVFPAGGPVIMVADMDKVKVVVYLSEQDIGKVKKGQKAKISVDEYPAQIFQGVISEVAPAADPATRKLKAEILVPNPEHLLKPGTFARVEIVVNEHKNILLVPRRAVLEREGKKMVFTCENNQAKIIDVLTGAEDEKNIEIKKGLKKADIVIVEGNYGLIEGTKIEIVK
ncbi:MAG: Macrolide export protein MacA [Elusimicrobia bacterium ADurb.Bin231]|nr:MAG: Macrolide export protein MacA [Elusimicrobia bacterium ADurb.Bin231]